MDRARGGTQRRFRIVGVGCLGWRVSESLRADPLFESGDDAEVRLIAVNPNSLALGEATADRRVHVNRPIRGHPGSFRDEMRWRDELDEEVARADLVLAVVGAADPDEIEITAIACRIANERGSLALAFVVGPLDDSASAPSDADAQFAALARAATTFWVPRSRLSPGDDEALVRQGIRSLVQIVRQRGLPNYSLKELRETFPSAGLAQLATGRGRGVERFVDAARSVVDSATLFQPLGEARAVVLHVRAPSTASLFDLNELGSAASTVCDPTAVFWLTVYFDPPAEDLVEITLFAAGLPTD